MLAADFPRPEEAKGMDGGLDAPGAGYIGLSGRGQFVALAEEVQDLNPLTPAGRDGWHYFRHLFPAPT